MEFEKLKQEITNCQKCDLHKTRTNAVVGQGNENTDIMLIGEAPGFNEDKQGFPFVGRAGKVLDEVLKSTNLSREEIYIANILKCRPPKNRNPKNQEIKTCTIHLNKQIELINPKIICCLGNFASQFIMEKFNIGDKFEGISKVRGQIFKVTTLEGTLKIMPMFHPAVATYNPQKIEILKQDFAKIKKELK